MKYHESRAQQATLYTLVIFAAYLSHKITHETAFEIHKITYPALDSQFVLNENQRTNASYVHESLIHEKSL